MDLTKLSNGDKVVAGSGIALFIFSFFPWYGVSGFSDGRSGWDYFFTGIVPTLLAVALVAYVAVTKLADGVKLPDLPVGWPLVVLGAAGLAALLVLLRLVMGDSVDVPFGSDFDLDRKFGIFLATLAAIGLAAGAFLKFQEDGGELPTKGGGASGTGNGSTPPTPF